MKYALAFALLASIAIAGIASYAKVVQEKKYAHEAVQMSFAIIDKLGNQRQQLIDIIRRCGAELTIDKDGNYDAIIPMTPEEFERFKDELRKRKQEHPTKPTGEPT